jgi:ankyrin repeat protein
MGKSKVFMRRKAFEGLEHLRNMCLQSAATKIQSCFRMHIARVDFDTAIYAVIVIQTFARRVGAYRMVRAHRAHCSAVRIQALWRASKARAKIRDEKWSKIVDASVLRIQRVWRGTGARRFRASALWIACWCQSLYRGARARQYCAFLFLDQKSRIIQRGYQRHKTTRFFRKLRRSVITLQNRHRSRLAKRELSRLRAEAKDLSKVAAERDLYRQELEQLRKELEEAKKVPTETIKAERKAKSQEVKTLREEVDRLRLELEKAHRMSETKSNQSEVQFLLSELLKREDCLSQLKREVESLRSKDDSFSVSLKSFYVEASPSSGKPRPIIVLPTQAESPYSTRESPVRSDVSLFDEGEEGSHEPNAPVPVEASSTTVLQIGDDVLHRLHSSIRNGDLNQLEQFLRTSTEMCLLINQGDEYGRTSLHVAALSLRADVVRTLIAKGAVVNAQDEDGETPLHLAENPDVTEVLLKKGRANPNIPNVDGICAIHLAVQRRDIDSVRHLLRHGADVNCADNIRWFTPLHLIALPARHDTDESPDDDLRTRIAQLLCGSMGPEAPDLDYQDSQSNAPLHYAAQLESKDICSLLEVFLEHGAKPNTTNERSQSPLHLLCHNTKLRLLGMFQGALRCILHHGADPNIQSLAGCTALHLTLYHRDVDSAIQLIEAGAELHLRWQKVRTVAC